MRRQRANQCTAFADRAREQLLRKRRSHQGANGNRSCRFARDGDALRVAAERRDILLYPAERCHLVEETVVARCVMARFLRQIRMREETEDAQAIVDGNRHDAFATRALAIVAGLRAVALLKAAAEDVNQNRKSLAA